VLSRCPRETATTKNSNRYKYVHKALETKNPGRIFSVCRDSTTAILGNVSCRVASIARATLAFPQFFVFKKCSKETQLTGGRHKRRRASPVASGTRLTIGMHDSSIARSRARDWISRYYFPFLDYERVRSPLSPFRFPELQFSGMHLERCEREREREACVVKIVETLGKRDRK